MVRIIWPSGLLTRRLISIATAHWSVGPPKTEKIFYATGSDKPLQIPSVTVAAFRETAAENRERQKVDDAKWYSTEW